MSKLQPVLIVPDVHRPYHSKPGWKLLMAAAKDLKPHTIVVIGDFADFYSLSSYSKDPERAGKLDTEMEDVRWGIRELESLKAKRKIFVMGNHEDRMRRYLQDKAPELWQMVSIEKWLGIKDWEVVDYKDHTTLGRLHLTHDVGKTGRMAVFNALDTYQHSVVTGHAHRLAYVVEGNAIGEQKLSAQFGWLGDPDAVDYMHKANVRKNWALGFGVGYLNPENGLVYLTPVPIVKDGANHTCVVNGKLYTS